MEPFALICTALIASLWALAIWSLNVSQNPTKLSLSIGYTIGISLVGLIVATIYMLPTM